MTKRNSLRALGLSAAIIVGAGGSIAASPAFAAPEVLPTAGAEFKTFENEAFEAGAAGVGTNAAGEVVLAVDETSDSVTAVEEVVGDATNVKYIMLNGPIEAAKQDEAVGGSGYMIPKGGAGYGLCSLAFSAWTPKGDDAFITAGHCGEVGENVKRSQPASDVEFEGGEQDEMTRDDYLPVAWDDLGKFTNSQFGAKDPYADDEKTATDVATIDKTNNKLKALPAVTKWGAAAKDGNDLAADATVIKSVGKAKAGQTVLKSGRTTGLTDGEVLGDMVFGVADPDNPDDPDAARYVKGFMATHTMRQGDSGGAWFNEKGEALGISSAISIGKECSAPGQCTPGTHDYSFVADLEHAVNQTPDYEVKLYVNAPGEPKAAAAGSGSAKAGSAQLPKPAAADEYKIDATPGQKIEGSIEKDATIKAVEGTEAPKDLTSKDGMYSFSAPEQPGTYTYKLQARKGKFNVSDPITIVVTVKAEPTEDPTQDPTEDPTQDPTEEPTQDPTEEPTQDPTEDPSDDPAERALSIDPENIKATDFVKKDAVTIAASGCTPGTEANLEVKPRGSNVTGHTDTATVDEDGNVGFSVYGENADMPNAYIGDYDVTVSCDGGDDLTGTFTVTEAGGKDDDGKGGDDKKDDNKDLPRTGSEALGSLGAAAALIAGGAGLYVLARRRKN
ncbi:trypsin-like serine protease [Brevibacterium luteolum]|uniref:trypsin-like serine protease n=1 Tax=Brevibacterium luteolum TaxID=199591 RepID=UPI001C2121AB|nr:trypsin-like serine protease [Brevibacterium luteolum]MBU8578777.1 LPXTG cell wall anchor domain-containing protein [Brevibacterium luteolum]